MQMLWSELFLHNFGFVFFELLSITTIDFLRLHRLNFLPQCGQKINNNWVKSGYTVDFYKCCNFFFPLWKINKHIIAFDTNAIQHKTLSGFNEHRILWSITPYITLKLIKKAHKRIQIKWLICQQIADLFVCVFITRKKDTRSEGEIMRQKERYRERQKKNVPIR